MKNVRHKPNTPTETRTIPARTQIAAQNSELAMSDLHRIQESYIGINRGSSHAPPQRTPRVDEVESRGWGRRAPQSPSSSSFGAPQGNNKIYKSDEVFLIEKAKRNDISQTQFPYKITKDISQTQFGRQTASQIGKGNQPTASRSTCPQVRASRAARYWMPRHPRTCRAIT